MTFTAVVRCPRSKMLGVAMATSSIAVGNRCPVVVPRMGAAGVQAIADPRLTLACARLIGLGLHAPKVVEELATGDPERDLRQIGVVDAYGHAAGFTGAGNGVHAAHILGAGFVAMGNALANDGVVPAIAASLTASEAEPIELRLMLALEAGRDAGGEHKPLNSSAMLIYADEPFSYLDLRVDLHEAPVHELRSILDRFRPLLPYFQERPYNPRLATHSKWLAENGHPPAHR